MVLQQYPRIRSGGLKMEEEKLYNVLNANPDEIVEFVNSLKPEELKTNIIWAFLKVREINLHNQKLQNLNTQVLYVLEEINRRDPELVKLIRNEVNK